MTAFKRMRSPAPFEAGVLLHQEEHEQEQKGAQLLVVQLDGKCQRDHWRKPLTMLAGLPTVEVGIYRAPCLALALGLPRMALSDATERKVVLSGLSPTLRRTKPHSGCSYTPNRYPARGSARVTPNLKWGTY